VVSSLLEFSAMSRTMSVLFTKPIFAARRKHYPQVMCTSMRNKPAAK